jgi:predicted metal-dependent enzyme (double-stranded beta helix superfamily)
MTDSLRALVAAVDAALDDASLAGERAKTDAMRPAMAALLADAAALPAGADEPFEGAAVGNLLHADDGGRYHVLSVVFPGGTSSGVHHHGCWGLIGYYRGGDEETRYVATADDGHRADLVERDRRVFTTGDITALLPEDDDGWHRVRNPGPGPAVSIHVLCRTPAGHPHRFWQRDGRVLDFPFVEVAPGRWRAEIIPA